MAYTTTIPSPVGQLYLSSDGESLTGLWMEGQKYFLDTLDEVREEKTLPVFDQARKWLEIYFLGKEPDFMPSLAPKATPFRQAVWDILCSIPYGKLTTYGGIARQLAEASGGKNVSAQAVGGAVGHNPISIFIPCHRVVGSNGSLTGYAGGIQTKIRLLTLEGAPMDDLFVPIKGTAL